MINSRPKYETAYIVQTEKVKKKKKSERKKKIKKKKRRKQYLPIKHSKYATISAALVFSVDNGKNI